MSSSATTTKRTGPHEPSLGDQIPLRSDDATLAEIGEDTRFIEDPEERAVAQELLTTAAEAGIADGRQLRHLLEDLGPQRRFSLDRLRERLGLKSATEIEQRERFQQMLVMAKYPNGIRLTGRLGPGGWETEDERERVFQENQARLREAEHQTRLDEAAAEADRYRPSEIKADNLL